MAEEAVAGDPQQAAYRVGYRTGFGDGFDAADKANAPKGPVLTTPQPTDLVFPKTHRDLLREILIDLKDLQFGFGNLALGLRDRCGQLTAFAEQPRGIALQRAQPG